MENIDSSELFQRLAPILVIGVFIVVVMIIVHIFDNYSLNGIKRRTVGDGQHGNARWATKREIGKTYKIVKYQPQEWRQGKNLPTVQGIIVGCRGNGKHITALIDDSDVHAVMIGGSGVGKTAFFLYPNIEYACAAGMSFVCTDTKGDIYRNYGSIAKEYYDYNTIVIDLRNPTRSDCNNLLHLVNRYMDLYLESSDNLKYKAKSEKYAKILSKTIIQYGTTGSNFGQNTYFYDAAEGLMTATIMLVSEFCPKGSRHIVSVFKILQELLEPMDGGGNQFQYILDMLPAEHKARWFAGSALSSSDQTMASVISTALSRLNMFLDSEMEQILCFENAIDAERFCTEKTAIFIVMPEEDNSKYFMVSLMIQQLCREILSVADEYNGKLPNRVMMYLDEFGTLPKIESIELMFSAARSRRISIVPIIQSFAQLNRNYGKEGGEIIIDNTQLTIFGGFSPLSQSADVLSKGLGNQTVQSGSISRGKNNPSQSLQMMGRRLVESDELKVLPRGTFVVMKTGVHPIQTKLKLYFKWGIKFLDEPYMLEERAGRKVIYANRTTLIENIAEKHPEQAALAAAKQARKRAEKAAKAAAKSGGKVVHDEEPFDPETYEAEPPRKTAKFRMPKL